MAHKLRVRLRYDTCVHISGVQQVFAGSETHDPFYLRNKSLTPSDHTSCLRDPNAQGKGISPRDKIQILRVMETPFLFLKEVTENVLGVIIQAELIIMDRERE